MGYALWFSALGFTATKERLKSFNSKLISTYAQDPGSGSIIKGRAKYPYFSRFTCKKCGQAAFGRPLGIGLLVLVFITLGSIPAKAEASILDKVLNFFTSEARAEEAVAEKETRTTQTLPLMEAAKNIDPNPTKESITVVDDTAFISKVGPSGTIADIETRERQGMMTTYTVRKGDTFQGIAKMFAVSVDTIVWANDLDRAATLHEGQTLVILPLDGVLHTVKKGDTLKSITKKYKGNIDEILEFNDIGEDAILTVGDTLIIPNGENAVLPRARSNTGSSARYASYPSYAGYYMLPVLNGHKTQGIHGHNGVDYGAPRGSLVYAAADGVVKIANYRAGNPWFGGYGNYVTIEHPNGTQTLYAHMSAVDVAVGETARQGQIIGKVGNTGRSTGPHLHFEVRGAKNPF